uniref:Succinate dehydrogenase [ubiquinone] cytochrome b small subunit n=1 Tax=Hemiscolopendra marginata TaxID=943146 RepID=A0A646QDH0_9MYRI
MASGMLLRVVHPRVNAHKLLVASCLRNFPVRSTPAIATTTSTAILPHRQSSSEAAHHDYSRMWTLERIVAASMLPIIPATIAITSPVLDYTLALLLTVHSHWSLENVIHDYVRPRLYGEIVPRVATAILYFFSAMILGGLCYFNYTDVGLGNAVRMIWKL